MNKQENSLNLPPTIPNFRKELEQAIMLLGNRVQTDLKDKTKKKLIKLVGEYPTKETAYEWKLSLKQIVKKEKDQKKLLLIVITSSTNMIYLQK
ncbi:hypothetical protein [Crocosphaera chwakensis]|nr:hypothetical protein [Crocosphaera chwakensis]